MAVNGHVRRAGLVTGRDQLDAVVAGQADNAYALCRPAGHHCLADEPMGFCLLANIPIAIEAVWLSHSSWCLEINLSLAMSPRPW